MNRKIDPYEHMEAILRGVKRGVLLTTARGGEVNTMTIAWGQVGIEWNRLIFTAFVRTGRYTHEMLESGAFTVNIPVAERDAETARILKQCGTASGRDTDKIRENGLTLVEGGQVDVPGIREMPLTLECRVLYKQLQNAEAIPGDLRKIFYPDDAGSENPGANRDYHTAFFGEIVGAHIVE